MPKKVSKAIKHHEEEPTPNSTIEEYHTKLVRFGYKNQISDQLIQTLIHIAHM
jgi:hypothetical protein